MERNYFNTHVWRPARVVAGLPDTRTHGMHAARHYYASVLLEGGTSIRTLADYLGHVDPGFTLRTYTHLMPEAEGKAKGAIDAVFVGLAAPQRVTQTELPDSSCGPAVALRAVY